MQGGEMGHNREMCIKVSRVIRVVRVITLIGVIRDITNLVIKVFRLGLLESLG